MGCSSRLDASEMCLTVPLPEDLEYSAEVLHSKKIMAAEHIALI